MTTVGQLYACFRAKNDYQKAFGAYVHPIWALKQIYLKFMKTQLEAWKLKLWSHNASCTNSKWVHSNFKLVHERSKLRHTTSKLMQPKFKYKLHVTPPTSLSRCVHAQGVSVYFTSWLPLIPLVCWDPLLGPLLKKSAYNYHRCLMQTRGLPKYPNTFVFCCKG